MKLAVIPGDGIGVEVIEEALRVLRAVHPAVEPTHFDVGAARWHRTGQILPDSVLEEIRRHDAILFGAVGDPTVPSGVLERGLLLRLRFELDLYVNLRPAKLYPGVATPLGARPEIDLVVYREGTEGAYLGQGGVLRGGTAHEVATEVNVNTAFGVERVVRAAFEAARSRPRRHLTLVHKNNVLVHAGALWSRVVEAVAAEYCDVTLAYNHVDAATIHLLTDPGRYDVIVTDNLFGDILTDLTATITGGIGLAASGNVDPSHTNPSLFEPVHGSAPDIAGRGVADPTAAVLSVAMLLEHLGHTAAADRVNAAVAGELAGRDPRAPRGTREIGERLAEATGSDGPHDERG
jgi:3-isopropylmalate dehydrogenase